MPKDPEDHPGDSHPDGDTPEENSPRPDDSPESSDSTEDQGELPFGGDQRLRFGFKLSKAEFPKSDLGKKEGEGSEPASGTRA